MGDIKITIKIDRAFHADLKVLAMKKAITLNLLCEDFLKKGFQDDGANLATVSEDPLVKGSIDPIVIKAISLYEASGLSAILKTPNCVSDYVFIFQSDLQIPERLEEHFRSFTRTIILSTHLPQGEHAPNIIWIQVAQHFGNDLGIGGSD